MNKIGLMTDNGFFIIKRSNATKTICAKEGTINVQQKIFIDE